MTGQKVVDYSQGNDRVRDLLSKLTLEQKVSLLSAPRLQRDYQTRFPNDILSIGFTVGSTRFLAYSSHSRTWDPFIKGY